MRRILLAGVAALALNGCTASEDGSAAIPGSALSRVAERLAAKGDALTAAALYRSAIAMGNTAPEVRRGYGNALLALGQTQPAIEQFEAALAQAKDARLYNSLGVAYDMLGDHARAQERFRAGLALAPDNKSLIHNYGLSLAAETEKPPAPVAEAAPEEPSEVTPAAAAVQPVPVDEPKPIVRPSTVPTVIPTTKSKPVAMRDSMPEPAPAQLVEAPAPTLMAAAAFVPAPAPEPAAAFEPAPAVEPAPALTSTPALEPTPVTEPAPALTSTPALEPAPVTEPAPTPELAAALEPAAVLASVPVADAAPVVSEAPAPFTRVNEIVPLGRPMAATPLHGDYFRVRLSGYASRERAMEFRREIARQVPELRESMRVVEERPSLALGARLRYTLVTAPLPSRRLAEDACDTLAERGLACLAEPAASPLTLRS